MDEKQTLPLEIIEVILDRALQESADWTGEILCTYTLAMEERRLLL